MATSPFLSPQFENLEQQHETHVFGMWVFLMTELMLFGALFTMYAAYRFVYPAGFAEASGHLESALGAVNTGVLILSSLMMALAVQSAQIGSRKGAAIFLVLTMLLGTSFMGIKALEYAHHFQEQLVPGLGFHYEGQNANVVQLFMMLYFAMTGLHAIHLMIGIALVGIMLFSVLRRRISSDYWTLLELTGLYWHFVDIVWIFLFPLLYLIQTA